MCFEEVAVIEKDVALTVSGFGLYMKDFKKLSSIIIILPYIYRTVYKILSSTLFHFDPYSN